MVVSEAYRRRVESGGIVSSMGTGRSVCANCGIQAGSSVVCSKCGAGSEAMPGGWWKCTACGEMRFGGGE